ncbi:MAG TPA: YlmC/YmxH family sporulation protein [Bacillota bacterium]|nr:YlmC/YmxH family sporulation protein [Bacillota bacterium]
MITLSELQMKEIIDIKEGKRLGHIHDLRIHPMTGNIESIILLHRHRKKGFFSGAEEIEIKWQHIQKIGKDVILVNQLYHSPLYLETTRNHQRY